LGVERRAEWHRGERARPTLGSRRAPQGRRPAPHHSAQPQPARRTAALARSSSSVSESEASPEELRGRPRGCGQVEAAWCTAGQGGRGKMEPAGRRRKPAPAAERQGVLLRAAPLARLRRGRGAAAAVGRARRGGCARAGGARARRRRRRRGRPPELLRRSRPAAGRREDAAADAGRPHPGGGSGSACRWDLGAEAGATGS
jgi:hypothetical protein